MKTNRPAQSRHCQIANDVISLLETSGAFLVGPDALQRENWRSAKIKRCCRGKFRKKMLTTTLGAPGTRRYLTRTVPRHVPPRVDYELTPLGIELLEAP